MLTGKSRIDLFGLVLFSIVICFADLYLPFAVFDGFLYPLVVIIAARIGTRQFVVCSTVFSLILVLAGNFIILPNVEPVTDSMLNHLGAVGLLVIVCFLMWQQKSSSANWGQQNRRLQALTDNLPVHLAEIGRDLRFNFINARFEKHLLTRMRNRQDVNLDTVIGEHVEDVLDPVAVEKTLANMARTLEGETVHVEVELPSGDSISNSIIRSGSYIPKYNDRGIVDGFFILTEDVTLRKQAEQSLQKSESLYRTLIERLPLSIVVTQKQKIVYANTAAVNMLGASTEQQLIGRDYLEFVHSDSKELARYRRSERDQKGSVDQAEYKQVRFDGSEFYTEVSGLSVTWEGELAGLLMIRDITEQFKTNRMKSEFVSIVSHELRTPLTSIKGALELMMGGALGDVPEALNQMLLIAGQNTDRLGSLVDDILDFEKLQSGKVEYNFETQPINLIVKSSMEINQTFAERYGVSFEFQSDGSNVMVRADNQRLSQVMSNLLSNAVKFSPSGEAVSVLVEKREKVARVSVSDHGPGIADADRHLIFERFSQADSSDTRSVGGTGLGLSISKAIIEDHQGEINFVSEVGKGSIFYFDLPLAA